VLVVTGDIEPARTLALVRKYFAAIPASKLPPPPDISEPRQEKEKRVSREDPLASKPALAVAYHTPPRNTPEWYAMGLIDEVLLQGQDSRLYRTIVRSRGLAGEISGGTNVALGTMFDVKGPTLWTASLIHDAARKPEEILAAIDEEVARLQKTPLTAAEMQLALIKRRSRLYAEQEEFVGFGRANLLASFALFDDDPGRINQLEAEFAKVTPALIQQTATEYLRASNRTVLMIAPKAAAPRQEKSR
jgi:zinc protease